MKPVRSGPIETPSVKHIVLIPITRARLPGTDRSALIPPIEALIAADTIPIPARSTMSCVRDETIP